MTRHSQPSQYPANPSFTVNSKRTYRKLQQNIRRKKVRFLFPTLINLLVQIKNAFPPENKIHQISRGVKFHPQRVRTKANDPRPCQTFADAGTRSRNVPNFLLRPSPSILLRLRREDEGHEIARNNSPRIARQSSSSNRRDTWPSVMRSQARDRFKAC